MEEISNYYEEAVAARLDWHLEKAASLSANDWADVTCIALNQLPSRYYRHGIDFSFYTSSDDQTKLDSEVDEAIDSAIVQVRSHPR